LFKKVPTLRSGQFLEETFMRRSPTILRTAKSLALVLTLAACGLASNGCAYSGMAATPDGTVVLARNSLLGANRKIFVCHVVGNALNCAESPNAP
jgi:hypothetical protein